MLRATPAGRSASRSRTTGPASRRTSRPVFDRFYRVDGSRTRATGGSGLGLAICREIVEAHGGRVVIAPRMPRGSAFTITLPVEPAGTDAA